MAQTIFYIILGIIVINYLFEQYLDWINYKYFKPTLPNELKDIYKDEEYDKSQRYKKTNARFGFLTDGFSFVLITGMLLFGGFAVADNIARQFTTNPIWISLTFFGILFIASDILTTPFSIYGTFVIEEKFGFNKTTIKTFILDKIKGWLLAVLIGGGLFYFIIWIYNQTQENFWVYAWMVISGFSIFFAMFYSSLIVPLFNKQTPLEEGELRNAIQDFSKKAGFKLDNIYVIDGSKRSTKANAYFSGLGPKKRIVLYDTLIKELTTNQLVAVLAHEIGHYQKKHIIKSMIIGIAQTGVMLYIFSLFIAYPVFSEALGVKEHSFHIAMITFGILYSPISTLLGLIMNSFSRKNEYEADAFAKKYYDEKELIGALKKLSTTNLSNLTPHPLYVFFHYSHPTLLQRIRALMGEKKD